MAYIGDFLKELAKGPHHSTIRDDWDARDREKAMTDFGLDERQQQLIRDALESEDLKPVEREVADERGEEEATPKVVLWVK
jgi:hypothetical protein